MMLIVYRLLTRILLLIPEPLLLWRRLSPSSLLKRVIIVNVTYHHYEALSWRYGLHDIMVYMTSSFTWRHRSHHVIVSVRIAERLEHRDVIAVLVNYAMRMTSSGRFWSLLSWWRHTATTVWRRRRWPSLDSVTSLVVQRDSFPWSWRFSPMGAVGSIYGAGGPPFMRVGEFS